MSTEREIVDLFQDAFEKGNIGLLDPYLTEDMTYKVLPTTFVVVLVYYRLSSFDD